MALLAELAETAVTIVESAAIGESATVGESAAIGKSGAFRRPATIPEPIENPDLGRQAPYRKEGLSPGRRALNNLAPSVHTEATVAPNTVITLRYRVWPRPEAWGVNRYEVIKYLVDKWVKVNNPRQVLATEKNARSEMISALQWWWERYAGSGQLPNTLPPRFLSWLLEEYSSERLNPPDNVQQPPRRSQGLREF